MRWSKGESRVRSVGGLCSNLSQSNARGATGELDGRLIAITSPSSFSGTASTRNPGSPSDASASPIPPLTQEPDSLLAEPVGAAERLGTREIATLDRRQFSIVRPSHVDSFTLLT